MIPKSVRWRLPLSYTIIALLAALALGGVLLTTLSGYYRQQELDYLTNNAQAIGSTIAPLLELDLPSTELQSQLRSFAFLSQTRVRLLDTQMQPLADSGTPNTELEVVTLAREEAMLEIQNAEDMPDAPADLGGLLLQRDNERLLVGTGALSGALVDGEWVLAHDGPVVEVVVAADTVIYRDDTLMQLETVSPSEPLEQILQLGALSEMEPDDTLQAWGQTRGDSLVASVIVYSPNPDHDRGPSEGTQGGPTPETAPSEWDEQPAVVLEGAPGAQALQGGGLSQPIMIAVVPQTGMGLAQSVSVGPVPGFYRVSTSAVATAYGFSLNVEAQSDGRRSTQLARQPFYGRQGQLQGYIELSEGPAYGQQILARVTRGWALAGAVAAVLAALAGWLVSRRITSPLLALTQVTASMAGGDLGARADTAQEDEFGALAQSFNGMADRVQATVYTLRNFVSDAAHELNTPLATLRTNLEMMQNGPHGQDQRLHRAQAQVARLEALTLGMLDLSRIESASKRDEFTRVPLSALVKELGEQYASRADQVGLSFEMSLPEGPVTVWGDGAQLRQAFTNLLDNAIKFTPEGGHLSLGVRQEEGWVRVWVEDTGIGIPDEDLPHLFQRFHRGRNTAPYPGNGLGLAIVMAIAERHGGIVLAENTGQGARFTLELASTRIQSSQA